MTTRQFLKQHLPRLLVDRIQHYRYARKVNAFTEETGEPEFRIIKHLVESGDSVVDIGANMGVYTTYMARLVGSSGKVYSIEPIPETYDLLSYVVGSRHLDHVHLMNYAVSDAHQTVTMEVPRFAGGEENHFEAHIVGEQSACEEGLSRLVKVETRTLDSLLLQETNGISFIKCDVEGHELACLHGAEETIRRWHPAWMVEIWGDVMDTSTQAFKTRQAFERFGYIASWYDGSVLRSFPVTGQTVNYFFLPSHRIESLRRKGLFVL